MLNRLWFWLTHVHTWRDNSKVIWINKSGNEVGCSLIQKCSGCNKIRQYDIF